MASHSNFEEVLKLEQSNLPSCSVFRSERFLTLSQVSLPINCTKLILQLRVIENKPGTAQVGAISKAPK